jgi:hypothetical protein
MPATSSRACSTADPGTTVRMMRTRLPRPRTIKSASPVGSWRTWSWSTRARARVVNVWRPVSSWSSTCQALGHPFGPGEAGQLGRLRRPEQQDAAGGREQPGALLLAAERDAGLASEDDTGAGGQGGWQHTAQGGHGAQEAASGPREADEQHG